ncbi:hypothetical protein [Aequorivita sp. CIP111184]|uniref:hypothetical protein n=1 Tax=Aequorivita sp. CIP111184 TaxID=2211356 RepID=UPI000DBC08E4|nr:hypothetical protein [Aequorivita sp. CIP111184]SRX56215.1 hypothetical protein AEQU1_03245 [Aequorivita sp. CIP111184]
MSLTSLVIKSKSNPPAAEYTWEKIGNIETFTKEIITPAIGGENEGSGNVGSIISGVPTIYARANMFRNAIDNVVDKDMTGSGLIHFYKYLIDEWRGLITCIALNHEKIEVKRISLTYSDKKSTENTENIYEPKGSFGNMLFERKPLWSNPNEIDSTPYIDILLYTKSNGKQIVVGGTTPDSFLFTSVAYDISGESSIYVKEEKNEGNVVGKFTDPLKRSIDPQSLNKLKSYVNHIARGTNKFKEFFSKVTIPFEFENVIGNLTTWVSEMDKYAIDKGYTSSITEDIPQVSNFKTPYNILFNYSTNLAGFNGVIYAEDAPEDAIEFNPNELLLPEDTAIACVDDDGNPNFLQNRPLLLLKADVKSEPNEIRHFMLPLSPKGIKIFGNRLSTVLGINNAADIKTRITATYDPSTSNLTVKLNLFSQTSHLGEIKKVYKTTADDIFGKDILLWPNFVSKKWKKYFLYSEMPHNSSNWQAIPFCGNLETQNFDVIMSVDDPEIPALIAKGGKETDMKSAHLKVELSRNVDGTNYEYEIFESKNPFKGFQMLHQNKLVGYAMIEYGNSSNDYLQIIDDLENLDEAHLGVDFGSTNSAIAYRKGVAGEAIGFTFNNRRVSLLDSDEKDNTIKPAGEDEIFFFQNDEIESNQIKSILSLHDTRRMKDDNGQGNLSALASEYVKGGFPCFEKNLPIEDSTDSTYILNFGDAKGSIGQSTLIHNMKWSGNGDNNDMEESRRKAYLSSLLLQVYADLFAKKLYPSSLKWSYPSAMGQNLIDSYTQIWSGLEVVNPLIEGHNLKVKKGVGNFDIKSDGNGWSKASDGVDKQINTEISDDTGWGSVTESGDWGESVSKKTQSEQNLGGWADEKIKIAKIEDILIDDNPITFDFQEIDDDYAMTESCAVANFLAQKKTVSTETNTLTICFDIGGSTTDILVLGQMKGPAGIGLSMVKQSSIRFAAQRVAQATKHSPNFKTVLIELLDKKGIKLEGINKGANKYTENTAPYYFEQLVDRLTDNEFDEFYRLLGAKCKEMVSVNVYITGLIVYYAGQIAKKVKLEIDKSPNRTTDWSSPKIQIQFTGKGSRIMDWLKAINPQADKKYYMDMFINGFGGMEAAKQHLGGPPIFQSRDNENLSSDVKYEVAKGLASTTGKLYIPKTDEKPLEVIGEDGFELISSSGQSTKLNSESSINALLMENIGKLFLLRPENSQKPCPKFMQFAHLYFQLATNYLGLKATQQDFMNGFQSMNISDYIQQMPEFKVAQRNPKGFDFVAPIIILEGMQFFENVILKKIAQK